MFMDYNRRFDQNRLVILERFEKSQFQIDLDVKITLLSS